MIPVVIPLEALGPKGLWRQLILLDVNFFQVVRFPAQTHSLANLISAVVITAAASGKLMFCLFLAAPEKKKQALGLKAPEAFISCTIKPKLFPLTALCRYQRFISTELV